MPDRTNSDKPTRPEKTKWTVVFTVLKVLTLLFFIGIFLIGGTATGYVASLVKDDPVRSHAEIEKKIFSNYLTGFAYFNDKTLIGQLRSEEDRRLVKKEEVSPHLINAIIATEDKHFYEHHGFDPNGVFRAAIESVTGSAVQTGGSTLTQQLIKQTILTPEVSYKRKAKEILLALRLERMFSKDQILEAYMNEMYFGKSASGSNIYGVQAAAKGIFGVDAKALNIPQAAYIAGMLQAPSRYIPFNADGLKAGKGRQKVVLERMRENGYITSLQYNEALQYDIAANLTQNNPKAYSKYPYLMMEIEERAARALADQEIANDPKLSKDTMPRDEYRELVDKKHKEILRGGYHIYTTIDKKTYEMMQSIAENPKNFDPNQTYDVQYGGQTKTIKNAMEEVGATLLDNKTGAIIGFIGGRDFKVQQYNHTTHPRQPGSAMKPLAAYAPAFEKGILQPGSAIDDAPIALDNGPGNPPHYPMNWNNQFQGLITAREALRESYNIPAIKTYLQVGIPEALKYVEMMGITTLITPKDNPKHNDYQAKTGVIGGLTQGLTVEEITNAYATFPNQGSFIDAYMIQKIVGPTGESVYEHTVKPKPVFSPQTAYLTTDMMRTVVTSGTGASVQRYLNSSRDIAGKTGTTNDDNDSWFVAYTPNVTLGVWDGFDIPTTLPKAGAPRPIRIWAKVMNGLFKLYPDKYPVNETFQKPPGIVTKEVCSKSGKLPTDLCRAAGTVITEVFNQKDVPTETCDVHQNARMIEYNGKMYLAKPETPNDMVTEKIALKVDDSTTVTKNSDKPSAFWHTLDWASRVSASLDPRTDDGKAPKRPKGVVIEKSTLTWNGNPEADIVGYRIYQSMSGGPFEKVGVVDSSSNSYHLTEHGSYYLTVVDVAGKESEPSDMVEFGGREEKLKQEPDPLGEIIPTDPTQEQHNKKDEKKKRR
jgi:penicillin-binding protein 1B